MSKDFARVSDWGNRFSVVLAQLFEARRSRDPHSVDFSDTLLFVHDSLSYYAKKFEVDAAKRSP